MECAPGKIQPSLHHGLTRVFGRRSLLSFESKAS